MIGRIIGLLKRLKGPERGEDGITLYFVIPFEIAIILFALLSDQRIFIFLLCIPFVFIGLIIVDRLSPRRRLTYLADVYTDMIFRRSVFCSLVCILCAGTALSIGDGVSAAASTIFAAICLAHSFVTKYRARRGFFADNQYEVIELIEFFSTDQSGQIPPGTRAKRQPTAASQNAQVLTEQLEGRAS